MELNKYKMGSFFMKDTTSLQKSSGVSAKIKQSSKCFRLMLDKFTSHNMEQVYENGVQFSLLILLVTKQNLTIIQ